MDAKMLKGLKKNPQPKPVAGGKKAPATTPMDFSQLVTKKK